MVDDTRLELVTSRTSSGCATSCANRLLRQKPLIALSFTVRIVTSTTNPHKCKSSISHDKISINMGTAII